MIPMNPRCQLTCLGISIDCAAEERQTENRPHAYQQHNSDSEQRTTDYTPPFLTPVFMSGLTGVAACALLRCVEGRVCHCLSE